MATKLYRFTALLLTIFSLGFITSCEKNPVDELGNPTIELKLINDLDETTALAFSVTAHDATGFGYACVSIEDYKAGKIEMTKKEVSDATPQEILIEGLLPATRYMVIVEAYNGNKTSPRVEKTHATNSPKLNVTISDLASTADGVTFKLQAEEGATMIRYAIYTKDEGEMHAEEDPAAPGFAEWRKWEEVEPLATGNVITKTLPVGDYVLEAQALVKITIGTSAKESFDVMVQDRPYAKIITSNLSSEGGHVKITRNKLCGNYYVGVISDANYTFAKVLDLVKKDGAKYLHTDDYDGTIHDMVSEPITDWAAATQMRVWLIPCDTDGKYSEDADNIVSSLFSVPKREYGGKAVITITEDEIKTTSYKATVTPSNYTQYFVLYNTKKHFTDTYKTDLDIIESIDPNAPGLLLQPVQTAPTMPITQSNLDPDVEYMICAIGIDNTGKLGELVKKVIITEAITFDSPASVDVEKTSITFENAIFKYTPKEGCTSVRYLFISDETYKSDYQASSKRVETTLAEGTKQNIITLSGVDLVKPQRKDNLAVSTTYILFTLPLDQNGKMGTMVQTPIAIPSYDLTNSITFKLSTPAPTFTPSGGKVDIKLSLLPTEGCFTIHTRMVPVNQNFSGTTELIQTIMNITTGSLFHQYEEDATKTPFTFKVDAGRNYYLYVLCRDFNNKFNNPTVTRLYVDLTNKTIGAEPAK